MMTTMHLPCTKIFPLLTFKFSGIGCSGEYAAEVARSKYLEIKAAEAEKKAVEDDDDMSRLNELIALAEADMRGPIAPPQDDEASYYKRKGVEASHVPGRRFDVVEEDEWYSQAVDEAEASYYNRKAMEESHVPARRFDVVEEEEWYSQAVDEAEAAYYKSKAKDASIGATSRMNDVDDSESDDELLTDFVSQPLP
jgi:hypothetical protein